MSGGIVGAGSALIGVIITALVMWRVPKIQARSSPYAILAERVVALELADGAKSDEIAALRADLRLKTQRIELLEGDFDVLVPELVVWDTWVTAGAAPPPPVIGEAARKIIAHHRKRRARLILEDHSGDYVEEETN